MRSRQLQKARAAADKAKRILFFAALVSCSSEASRIAATHAGGTVGYDAGLRTGGGPSIGGDSSRGGAASISGGAQSTPVGGSSSAAMITGGTATGGALASGGVSPIGGSTATGASTTHVPGTTGGTSANLSQPTGGAATGGTWATGGNRSSTQAAGGSQPGGGTPSTGGHAPIAGGTASSGGAAPVGGASTTGGKSSVNTVRTKCSVYIAGDSTVSTYNLTSSPKDQAGWGQMLQQLYDGSYVTVVNKAVGGMTARHFIQAGNLDAILPLLKSGDYFFVQFGTNDSNKTATYTIDGVSYPYFADANTDFKTYLQKYIDGALSKGATPVLVTPPPRNSAYCNGGRSMADYAQAMLDLGKAKNVAVVDLSIKAWTYLSAICPKPTDGTAENFFKVNADNSIDGTHFQETGALKLAGFVAAGVGELGLGLDASRIK